MKRSSGVVCVGALSGVAFVALNRLGRRWGATVDELDRPMPGDEIVARPKGQTTHGITIHAAADDVWPWVVQMGYHRAGWYTYPWVDRYIWRIENPSADRIEPELQDVSVGSIIPDGEPGTAFFVVEALERPHQLVLHSRSHIPEALRSRMWVDWTWAFELLQPEPVTTRLVLRVRATFGPWWVRLPYEALLVPSDFVMARSMLRGIARRAEGRLSSADHRNAARRETRRAA